MVSVGAASMTIGPRMQGFRYLHGRITGSLEIGTLIQYIADFSPRCIIKQSKTHSNAIHSKNHWETQTLLKQITTSNDQLQWVTFHIHILELKGYNPPFEVSKVAITYRNFHIIIATIQTIEYWIRHCQFHLSYVKNVSDTTACLKTTFLMWYQAICGEFCSYRQLPTHLTRLGRHQWTPCFV